jgi:hypothetical protein
MKFFIDTAILAQIKEANELGIPKVLHQLPLNS